MEDNTILGEDLPLPPARLFERLAQVPNYTWDHSCPPFHSTYDHWHVLGILHNPESLDRSRTTSASIISSRSNRSGSARSSPKFDHRPSLRHHHWSSISGNSDGSELLSPRGDSEPSWTPVVARVSTHVVKLEREFNYNKTVLNTSDPEGRHTVRAIDIFRLPTVAGDTHSMMVCVYEAPGKNYLRDLLDFGPAFYGLRMRRNSSDATPPDLVPLASFLDFAVGACECLELLHHNAKVIHGEVRQDTFHWNKDANVVRLVNSGNGPRAFENLLSSEGWSTLSRELGVKNKLQFIAPEQTGRLPSEPDSRTDVYSLGILFWMLLAGRPAFDADLPIDIVQKVLSSRLPLVSSIRMDIPDALANIIAKSTQKQMDERYHSISGLKWDLTQIQKFLGEGDQESIKNYQIGLHDVSAFFILPSKVFGRQSENDKIFKIIEKVQKRQGATSVKPQPSTQALLSAASNSSVSEEQTLDGSDTSSSLRGRESRSNSTTIGLDGPGVGPTSGAKPNQFPKLGRTITGPRSNSIDMSDRESSISSSFHHNDSHGLMGRRRNSHKYKRKGKTEVISLIGEQGVGKTTLIKTAQPQIRRHGYFALARFDRAKPTPFEPLIKVMSSLFRQIFSERDVSSVYHEHLRSHIRPFWSVLHSMLSLPESLIETVIPSRKLLHMNSERANSIRTDIPSIESTNFASGSAPANTRDANDFLRGPANTKSIRFINTYLDVLRLMSAGKVICICLDDLQAADHESMELIVHIIKARVPVVLMLASRSEDGTVSEQATRILQLDSSNKIQLANLREKYVFEYVAETMSQDVDTVLPLAAVVSEKSRGNPFMIKEILQTCYTQDCLWYDWRSSGWQYDLDKVFTELSSAGCFDDSFITRRMQDMDAPARSILAWASLIGNTFSYKLVQEILGGQYFYNSGRDQGHDVTCPQRAKKYNISESDCLDGLQQLMGMYMIMPGESDDEYRFTNARYLRAANEMRECQNTPKMHFIIVQAMMSYLSECKYNLYPLARHICLAADIIKDRVKLRSRHRDVLWRGAQKASESGAQSTALWYYKTSIKLLQDDKWNADNPDVCYDETLQLYVNTAEMMVLQDENKEAAELLQETFVHARSAPDMTRSYILQGKIYSKQGRFDSAFGALRNCLSELGLALPPTTWEECDIEFKKLEYKIREMNREELVARPPSEDKTVIAFGTILSDTLAAAYWYDALVWYQLVLANIKIVLEKGIFIQAGIGFNMLGTAAVGRFKDIELGLLYGEIAQDFYTVYDDPWTRGRGWTLYALFLGHMQTPLRNLLPILENALEYSLNSGDRFISLVNIGAMALSRFYAGQDLAEVEAFCTYGPEEFEDWEKDMRGGALIVATRQVARALQGKTDLQNAETLLDDQQHTSANYLTSVSKFASNPSRARDIYEAITLGAYHIYGHHEYVVRTGRRLLSTTLESLWSNRPLAGVRFYLALSLIAVAKQKPESERKPLIQEAKALKAMVDVWGSVQNVNYQAWSNIIASEIASITQDYYNTVCNLEQAIDHCQVHGFALEEALAVEMQAEFLLARGAKRAGKVMVQEAMAAWNRINALGKAKQLSDKHEWLLKTATTARTIDIGVQTSDVPGITAGDEVGEQSKHERTQAWAQQPKPVAPVTSQDVPGMGLDILDLTSILEFSRVISSELQIDALLSKMTTVILESVGGQAEFCAIVIDSEDKGWCVAASADHDSGVKTYPDGIPFSDIDDQASQQIAHYVFRTKEAVFLPNVLDDERFANVGDSFLALHPEGRAMIAIPIVQADHLMGLIHLQGRPNAFTQRNMIVLNLLTNQVAISLGNALLYRKVRKVSASNASMIESQKRALVAAREAETKAKKAEAEAMHNVKLKEEAAKAKSIFLANVSHELRTPLNGVIGMSELLKGTPLNKDQEGYADSIRVCADTLLTVINDILDFSKLEAGKMQMFAVPLNLKETITEVVRALAYTNQEHGLQTIEELDIEENLVLGDPVRLHQIFMNLLSNAYKFTPKGSVTVTAKKIAETSSKVKITCSVADTGIGITEEQLTRLFQPFSQADSSTARSYGGSGLGLSICKAMIENVLGGKIWIESTPGVGTTVSFTLTFQKAPKDSSVPSDMKIAAKDPDPMANWSRSSLPEGDKPKASFCDLTKIKREDLRVCIAEDNAINRKIAISFVKKLGMTCEAYEDGKLAYEALQRKSKEGDPFHLVLMDVQMPVLDGYEATKAIRADPDSNVSSVLIIAMTASAIRGDREKCLEAGMNDYLAKPVRQAALKTMLDEYLTNANAGAASGTNRDIVTPGDKANGSADAANDNKSSNLDAGQRRAETSRSPMRKKDLGPSQLSQTTNLDFGPPSGKRETDELGKISTEKVSPTKKEGFAALAEIEAKKDSTKKKKNVENVPTTPAQESGKKASGK